MTTLSPADSTTNRQHSETVSLSDLENAKYSTFRVPANHDDVEFSESDQALDRLSAEDKLTELSKNAYHPGNPDRMSFRPGCAISSLLVSFRVSVTSLGEYLETHSRLKQGTAALSILKSAYVEIASIIDLRKSIQSAIFKLPKNPRQGLRPCTCLFTDEESETKARFGEHIKLESRFQPEVTAIRNNIGAHNSPVPFGGTSDCKKTVTWESQEKNWGRMSYEDAVEFYLSAHALCSFINELPVFWTYAKVPNEIIVHGPTVATRDGGALQRLLMPKQLAEKLGLMATPNPGSSQEGLWRRYEEVATAGVTQEFSFTPMNKAVYVGALFFAPLSGRSVSFMSTRPR